MPPSFNLSNTAYLARKWSVCLYEYRESYFHLIPLRHPRSPELLLLNNKQLLFRIYDKQSCIIRLNFEYICCWYRHNFQHKYPNIYHHSFLIIYNNLYSLDCLTSKLIYYSYHFYIFLYLSVLVKKACFLTGFICWHGIISHV